MQMRRAPLSPRSRLIVSAMLLALATASVGAQAAPALFGSFLSAGLTEALSRLGKALDSSPSNGGSINDFTINQSTQFEHFRLWSLTLSASADDSAPGTVMFSGQDRGHGEFSLLPVVLTGAADGHAARSLKFEITTRRWLPFDPQQEPVPVFSLSVGAAQSDTALQTGIYAAATATADTGAPLLDVMLGKGNCHSAARDFTIEELRYVGEQLAQLTLRFNCGANLHGVLRYEDTELSGNTAVLIRGQLWEDQNADGMRGNDGDNQLNDTFAGVRVNLLSNGRRVATARSDSDGIVEFKVLPGDYQVAVVAPENFRPTLRDVGGDEDRDSDVDAASGVSDVLTLSHDSPELDLTIGLTRIGGRGALPLASTRFMSLVPGDRVSYQSSANNAAGFATDTVLPGSVVLARSRAMGVQDSAGNLLLLSNDAQGLRLHRAEFSTTNGKRRYRVEFAPPLGLLRGAVEAGSFKSAGLATVRRVDVAGAKIPAIVLRYASSNELSATSDRFAGVKIAVQRTLNFRGSVVGTALVTSTSSDDYYAQDSGEVESYVQGAPSSTYLTATRRGLGKDFDGDRRADLLAFQNTGIASIAPTASNAAANTGKLLAWHPRLNADPPQDLGSIPASVALSGDFDGDGHIELVSYDVESGLLSILRASADGYTVQPFAFTNGNLALLASGDFRRNGHLGLVFRDTDTNMLSLWTLDDDPLPRVSDITDAHGVTLSAPPGYALAGAGDFDADGSTDLLWQHVAERGNTLWLMNGAQCARVASLPNNEAGTRLLAVNDFDGDGHSDIIWFNPQTLATKLWSMNGEHVLTHKDIGRLPRDANVIASGDYNGDGTADLLLLSSQQTMSLWPMRNGVLSTSLSVGSLPAGVTIIP